MERRRDPRFTVDIDATALFAGAQKSYRVVDISRGGALLEREDAEPPESLHSLVLDPAGPAPLCLLARITWVSPRHHAVQFVAQDDVDRLDLAEAVDRLMARFVA